MLSSLYPALVPKPDSFPVKLYQLVGAAVERGICTWTSNEFVIVNKELLCSSLLPLYFRHCRMDSFQRQLHMCAASSAITRHGSEAGATGSGRVRARVRDGWMGFLPPSRALPAPFPSRWPRRARAAATGGGPRSV